MAEKSVTIHSEPLKELVIARLTEVGTSLSDARTIADILVYADLRGIHSHGVLRTEHYTNRVRQGGINLQPNLSLQKRSCVTGIIDAGGGFGHTAAKRATESALSMAKEHGLGLVGVRNSSHCGSLGYYVDMALEEKMMCVCAVNTDSAVVPFGGTRPFFGTNPFAFGFPGEKDSILLDMATSEVAFGKIFYARENNTPIPDNWAVAEDGSPTTDPHKAFALFPFGGYKGFGINIMVEALTGLLIGGAYGPQIKSMYGDLSSLRNLAGFHLIIDPRLFGGENTFKTAQSMIDSLHSQPAAEESGEILIPGEIQRRNLERSLREGIQIPASIYEFLSTGKTAE